MFIDGEDEELDLGDIELDDVEEDDESLEVEDSEDEDEDEELEADEEEEAPRGRANERIRRLTRQRKEEEAEKLKLKNELDQLRAQQAAREAQSHGNDAAARAQYLANLPADQRVQAELQMTLHQHRKLMQQQQFSIADTADKSAFDAKAITNPLYAKFADRVELKLQQLRSEQNITAPREEVLKHLIGEIMLKKKGTPVSKKDAKASKQKQTVTTGKNKSNMSGSVRKGSTPKSRLEGVKF